VLGQTLEAVSKVTTWVSQAESQATSQVDKVATPILAQLAAGKKAAQDRKLAMETLRQRGNRLLHDGALSEVKAVVREMESALQTKQQPPASLESLQGQSVFRRESSSKEVLHGVLPRVVGQVSDGRQRGVSMAPKVWELLHKHSYGCCYSRNNQKENYVFFPRAAATSNSLLLFYLQNPCCDGRQPGIHQLDTDFTWFPASSDAACKSMCFVPSASESVLLSNLEILIKITTNYLQAVAYARPNFGCPVLTSNPVQMKEGFPLLLSHDSTYSSRNAYVLQLLNIPGQSFQHSSLFLQVQEVAVTQSSNPDQLVLGATPLFRVVHPADLEPAAFDVSSDAEFFVVLSFIYLDGNVTPGTSQARVSVYRRMQAEPISYFFPRTPPGGGTHQHYLLYTADRNRSLRGQQFSKHGRMMDQGDVCFSRYQGREVLRVAVSNDDTVYTLDHENNCAVLGHTNFPDPQQLRVDGAGRLWVVCSNCVIVLPTESQ
jgi:hypothetical protein